MFSLLSFNLWGKFGPAPAERWVYAAKRVKELDADILCLQEASDPYLLDQFSAAVGKKIVLADHGSTGLAVLTNLPARNHELVTYRAKSPMEPYWRKFIWVRFEADGRAFHLGNTHLSYLRADDEARKSQARQLCEFAAQTPGPVLLAGDFNAEFSSPSLEVLREFGYRDAMKGFPDEAKPTWKNANPFTHFQHERFADRRIDLILASQAFAECCKVDDCRIVLDRPSAEGVYPSDHFGVMAKLSLAAPAKK